MPVKSKAIFTNEATRSFIQENGIGTTFTLYDCQAITEWSRDYDDPTYVKVKSPNQYGKKIIKETIAGSANEPTFTVAAYTSDDEDWLLGLDCPVDFQVHFGRCSSPSDLTGYTKIRHFYRASPTSEQESNLDFIGDEEYAGVEQQVQFTCEEIITILKTTVASSANGSTEIQAFNDIDFLTEARCEGNCGQEIKACKWGLAVADSNYGSATANVWYSTDGGANWTNCAVDPFSENSADMSACVILQGETAPRFIVFRGTISGSYGARCSLSDDWGATWTEVDMGGNTNGSFVTSAFAFSAGMILATGNGGYVYKSEDRGSSWTAYSNTTTGTSQDLWDIHSPDGVWLIACGTNNVIIKSVDGGTSWTSITGPSVTTTLWTIQAPSKYRLLVGGSIDASSDCLWYSEDGGSTWNDLDFTGSTTALGQVRRLRLTNDAPLQHWVFIHGANNGSTLRWGPGINFRFYRTLDGGGSFERQSIVTNSGLNGLSVCDINTAVACGEPQAGLGVIQKMYND